MNSVVKKKWIDALRSGEYEQGMYELKTEDAYCCLGVLCDLHAKETGNSWTFDKEGNGQYLGVRAILPHVVASWAELPDEYSGDADVQYLGGKSCLTELNDDTDCTFNDIADIIEQQL